jgi:16S rRNA processing protein RimM
VAVVPPDERESRWHVVRRVMQASDQSCLLALSGVSDLSAAEGLVGKTILAEVDDLPEGFEMHDVDALLGREVHDARYGSLGRIREVLRTPASDVWLVENEHGERLIPMIDECLVSIEASGPVEVRLLDGMLEAEEASNAD